MRKYIITPALLAIVCMVMCHCTFNRKASVAANEYLIQSFVGRPFSLFVATLGTTEFLPDRFAYQEDAPRSIRGRYIRLRSDG